MLLDTSPPDFPLSPHVVLAPGTRWMPDETDPRMEKLPPLVQISRGDFLVVFLFELFMEGFDGGLICGVVVAASHEGAEIAGVADFDVFP